MLKVFRGGGGGGGRGGGRSRNMQRSNIYAPVAYSPSIDVFILSCEVNALSSSKFDKIK